MDKMSRLTLCVAAECVRGGRGRASAPLVAAGRHHHRRAEPQQPAVRERAVRAHHQPGRAAGVRRLQRAHARRRPKGEHAVLTL